MAEHVEARWRYEGNVPTFDEYLENGLFTSAARLSFTQMMIAMDEADTNAYEWDEEKRGIFATASRCYMKQHKVSRKEAIKAFQEMIGETWKMVNEGYMRPTPVAHELMRVGLNYQRMLDFAYTDIDHYTKPEKTFKHLILKVFAYPIPL
ncbi:hypothetical protein COLO4_15709 [Corchorus olitorius]|uniref:Terpene synthase metal-binding domain-containing protein n=1 Tax=Corchorus olitorius TaxID=93759 RepID=A0A1R3JLN6_9ROSI|nr:hypothetical protein COLO4_15709 [Corchorus olitorius]